VAGSFIASAEFASKYGGLDTAHFVTQLYQNVLHRAPESDGLSFWEGVLDRQTLTRSQVLAEFSESPENQANVIGAIQDGVFYTP
jgi:hypothetical protein